MANCVNCAHKFVLSAPWYAYMWFKIPADTNTSAMHHSAIYIYVYKYNVSVVSDVPYIGATQT